jgi:CelD/BcsL family acetyltransferase involved in cellulose biosynthesis
MLERSPEGIEVGVVDSLSEFAALEHEWERVQKDATIASIFSTFDWLYLWWKIYGAERPLRLLVARSGGAVVGILPLYIDTLRIFGMKVRTLLFVGVGGDTSPDDLGPVLARGREAEVAAALTDAVMALPGWDVLLFTDMNPACAFTDAIGKSGRVPWVAAQTGRSVEIKFLELPASWDDWLKSLHRDKRYRIKNIRKKLNAAHPTARFFVWQDAATLDAGVDRLVHLHNKRWESAGQKHGFSTTEYVSFHRAVMNACMARDRLRFYCLEIDGAIVAVYYFYRFRNRVYLMQSGFDPDFSDVKPGQVLLGHVIESAIAEQHEVLDFLRGDHRYKDELASGQRETRFVSLFRLGPASLIYRTRRGLLPKVKAQLLAAAKRLPPGLAARLPSAIAARIGLSSAESGARTADTKEPPAQK